MSRLILSTIGTSLLTQQIDRGNQNENDWYGKLRDTANLKPGETPDEVKEMIYVLKERAIQKLEQSSTQGLIKQIRSASAELNGIYGFYEENLRQGRGDMHWLISTDTTQGRETAEIVKDFLCKHQISAEIFTPKNLSTESTEAFSEGIDDLLTKLEDIVQGYNYICFNLVGGFKALQGYLNTIGMFYADEIIYIFEGANSDLIRIPRLPVKVDNDAIAPYKTELALMAAGAWRTKSQLKTLSESLVFSTGDECTLSNWGRLIWNQTKSQFLAQDLLDFPQLTYLPSFQNDYRKISEDSQRVKLQEVLAKVSYLLIKGKGDTSLLKADGGLQYDIYTHQRGVAHFRVTQGLRVSCVSENSNLVLRRYGKEPDVNRNP
jgi:putative CRISPR-associated protein (TIGR02619 family)